MARPVVAGLVAWQRGIRGRLSARPAACRRAAARRPRDRVPGHGRARAAARVHARPDLTDLPDRDRRRQPDHSADQAPGRRRFLRPARDPAVHPGRRAHGIRRHLRTHRRFREGHRRPRSRWPRDGRRRRRDSVLRHFWIDSGRRLGNQLTARAVDAESGYRDRKPSASCPPPRRWASSCRRA